MATMEKPNGSAAAAILAAAIGVFVIGAATTLAELIPALRSALDWWAPAGPLTGKTGVGVIAWLAAWLVLGSAYRRKTVSVGSIILWSWILIAAGFVLTFPPVFEAFAK